jgi:1-acyl-sn-glycerol-3-phosphate acyltransferase
MNQDPQPAKDATRTEARWFRAFHDLLYLPSHMTATLGFSFRHAGQRNMPATGPALLVANHQSYLDPPLVGLAAHRPLVYLARKTLFRNPYFASIIRLMNAVPIDQDGVGKEGIRTILDQLQLGKAVLVFPEGTRTPNGTMQPLKAGIQLLIKRAQAPIVPVGIAGAYDAWPIWRKYPLPAPIFLPCMAGCIAVSLGKPVDAARFAEMPREQSLQALFDLIQAEVGHAEKLRRQDRV